jgi:hypothetical protein
MTRGGEQAVNGQGKFHVDAKVNDPQAAMANDFAQAIGDDTARIGDGGDFVLSLSGPAKSVTGLADSAALSALDKNAPMPKSMNMSLEQRLDLADAAANHPKWAREAQATGRGPRSPQETTEQAKQTWEKINNDFGTKLNADLATLLEKAKAIREAREAAAVDARMAARDKAAGVGASNELRRIETGRQAIGNVLGLLAASKAGGLPGALGGMLLNKPLSSATLKGIDFAGAAGQRLSAMPELYKGPLPSNAALVRLAEILQEGH